MIAPLIVIAAGILSAACGIIGWELRAEREDRRKYDLRVTQMMRQIRRNGARSAILRRQVRYYHAPAHAATVPRATPRSRAADALWARIFGDSTVHDIRTRATAGQPVLAEQPD